MMDIRAYFQTNRKTTEAPRSNQLISNSNSRKRVFLESDSEDEKQKTPDNRRKKITEKTSSKRKAITLSISESSDSENETNKSASKQKVKQNGTEQANSKKRARKLELIDSSSEDVSPSTKRKPVQKKLEKVRVKSKFFKETSASAVFGDEPVKRDSSRLQEIKEKLKKPTKPPKNEIELEDDADFEAALLQLDDVGSNWIDTNKLERSDSSPKTEQPKESPKKSAVTESSRKTEKSPVKSERKCSEQVTNKKETKKSPKKDVKNSPEQKEEVLKTKPMRLSFKDKLKEFAALAGPEKQVTEKIMSTEKLLSTSKLCAANSSSSSGYSSLSSRNSDSLSLPSSVSNSQSSDNSETPEIISVTTTTKVGKSELGESKNSSDTKTSTQAENMSKISQQNVPSGNCSLWVEKYKPDSTKKIIGQQGDKSNVKKLINWLNEWYKNNSGNKKAKYVPAGWNKDQTGASFKAALLSGPPGVGKTTSVTLVCKELGFDAVEFNASDTRSKRLLQEEVGKLLTNTSISSLFSGDGGTNYSVTKKHVLVMDEVDGMAGNEDRGGIQELIQLIKMTKVPIICMCNDRNHPKIRSLVNYCFDLRFQRPRVEQIKGYMKTVCFKEKLEIESDLLTSIITASNNDVRLVLNHLSMLAADKNSDLEASKKYVKLNPWDVLRKVFSKEEHKTMSIYDKCDLFFYDYSIAPLFVQENYLTVKPLNVRPEDKIKKMHLFARAADSISVGDRIDKQIRTNSAWSLLPTQAIFSSYIPGEILEGHCTAMINFPAWLGKNSRKGKIDRLLQEIQIHTRLRISASKESVNLEYAPFLRNRIVEPLIKDGADGAKLALDMLHEYDLLKEDLDSLNEICNWPNSVDPMCKIESKVKAAFTRLYNKNPPVRPYSLTAPIKKNQSTDTLADELSDEEVQEEEDAPDAMIIVKKKQPNLNDSATPSTSRTNPKSSKESSKKSKKK